MIQSLDPARENFLASLQLLQRRITNDQTQLSTSLRINKASDAPGQIGDVVQLSTDADRAAQIQKNIQLVQGATNTAESALQSATQILDQVRAEGAQGASNTQFTLDRSTLAQQVGQQLSQLVNLSRTTFAGNYVFSGDSPTQPQYDVNLSNPNGVDRLMTTQATTQVQDVNGIGFQSSLTAQDIFDHRNPDDSLASNNVFAAVNSLRVALQNNDQPGITAALTNVQNAQDYLNGQLGFYGAVQNRLASSLTAAQNVQVQWQTSLGQVRDADIAAVSTDMTAAETNQQAALAAEAHMPQTSLFDFLK
ncbi:MAG TPA: flagellin [Bryobacteraceae bacterium]|nr:flagellin [Bryobacteraceae bacterium]